MLSTFLLEVVLMSLSGVIAPGPVTAITFSKGTKSPHARAIIAQWHSVNPFILLLEEYAGWGG